MLVVFVRRLLVFGCLLGVCVWCRLFASTWLATVVCVDCMVLVNSVVHFTLIIDVAY